VQAADAGPERTSLFSETRSDEPRPKIAYRVVAGWLWDVCVSRRQVVDGGRDSLASGRHGTKSPNECSQPVANQLEHGARLQQVGCLSPVDVVDFKHGRACDDGQ